MYAIAIAQQCHYMSLVCKSIFFSNNFERVINISGSSWYEHGFFLILKKNGFLKETKSILISEYLKKKPKWFFWMLLIYQIGFDNVPAENLGYSDFLLTNLWLSRRYMCTYTLSTQYNVYSYIFWVLGNVWQAFKYNPSWARETTAWIVCVTFQLTWCST